MKIIANILFLTATLPTAALAQTEIRGVVVDAATGNRLPGARVE